MSIHGSPCRSEPDVRSGLRELHPKRRLQGRLHVLRPQLRVLDGCANGKSERLAHPANGEPDGSTDGTDGDAKRQSEYVA